MAGLLALGCRTTLRGPAGSSYHTSRIRHGGFVLNAFLTGVRRIRGLNAFLTGVRRISPPKVRVVDSHFVGGASVDGYCVLIVVVQRAVTARRE